MRTILLSKVLQKENLTTFYFKKNSVPNIHNGEYFSDLWILASKNLRGKGFVTPLVNLGSPKCALLLNLAVKFSKNNISMSERWLGEPNYGDILEE